MPLEPETISDLVERLCAWFAANRRDLPWRRTRDPYAIWISEAMLQQTRVEAVLGHYARFLARCPTVEDLADASEDDVIALWSGLGYYRRARSLHAAARTIVAEHGGRFPDRRDAFLALPGVGPYTAGAVLSIAFQRSEPLVDGNVARVFSRLFLVDDEPGGKRDRKLWALAAELVPDEVPLDDDLPTVSPGNWNQALMELGALVCTPREPRCLVCPLVSACAARAQGREAELPRKAPKRQPVDVELELLVVERDGSFLLHQRDGDGRMASMWEVPTREVVEEERDAMLWPARHRSRFRVEEELGVVKHGITHHRIRGTVRRAQAVGRAATKRARWVASDELTELGLTGLTRKVLRDVLAGSS